MSPHILQCHRVGIGNTVENGNIPECLSYEICIKENDSTYTEDLGARTDRGAH